MMIREVVLFYLLCLLAMVFVVPAILLEFLFPSQVRFR